MARSEPRGSPSASPSTVATRLPSCSPLRSTNHAPPGNWSIMSDASCSARRVFPMPPMPTIVIMASIADAATQFFELLLATDERRDSRREVVWVYVYAGKCRELRAQFRPNDLVRRFREAQIFQPITTELAKGDFARQDIPQQRCGSGRNEDLPAVANGHKPGSSIERRAKVVRFAFNRRTRMDAYPNSNLANVRRPRRAF